jgi:hypothetical protein
MSKWVMNCRAISQNARLLYPTKLPHRPLAIEAVTDHERHFAQRENGELFRRQSTVKLADLPIGA